MFSHAAENQAVKPLPSMGRHYNQVRAQRACQLQNLDGRIAYHDQ
jgi:hypothetical protein